MNAMAINAPSTMVADTDTDIFPWMVRAKRLIHIMWEI